MLTKYLKQPLHIYKYMLNTFWNYIVEFFTNFGWQAGFLITLAHSIFLTISWVRREKHLQLVEIALENFIPKIKFELNKDDKLKSVIEENIILKAENALLKKQNNSLPFIIIGFLFLSVIISKTLPKSKSLEIDNQPDPNEPPIIDLEKDPFNLDNFKVDIKDFPKK